MHIRPATEADLPAINDLYNHYVSHSTCTYQTVASTMEERRAWFLPRGQQHPVRVMEDGGVIVAWHALSSFKPREAYARTVENSIYVHHEHLGKGLGRRMMEDQLAVAKQLHHHAILAVIDAEQLPSLKLHGEYGYEKVAHMRELGFKFDRWLDVIIMQKLL